MFPYHLLQSPFNLFSIKARMFIVYSMVTLDDDRDVQYNL